MKSDKDNNENKIPPPVELTDEQLEAAAGGTDSDAANKAAAEGYTYPVEGSIISWSYLKGYPNLATQIFYEDFKCVQCTSPSSTFAKVQKEKTLETYIGGWRSSLTYYGYERCKCFDCNKTVDYYLIAK